MRASGVVIVAETATVCTLGRRIGLMTGYDGALPNPRGVKLTYDDFVLFPDDGLRHALIDGEHSRGQTSSNPGGRGRFP
jgi:hypothetical protein